MLIGRALLQSRKYLFQHQHGDYSHYTGRAKESLRVIIHKLELRVFARRQCMGLL